MLVREARQRPKSWNHHRDSIRSRWSKPLHAIEWSLQWAAYYLSRWAFLEVLEYIGSLSVLVAVIFYFAESGDRKKQKHYQAWQVINTAQGKGGSGGRIDAMEELNRDRVALVGVDASEAFLEGVRLHGANLLRCDLSAADLRLSDLSSANLEYSNLQAANFQWASLRDANLDHAKLDGADFGHTDLSGAKWRNIASINHANVRDVRNAPAGFIAWAIAHGAGMDPDQD
jgi:Pentapeptide repeats (8 copies)